MFVLLLIIALICILSATLMGCQSIKWWNCRYAVSIVLLLVIVLSYAVFAIELISYLKGGIKTTQYATLSNTKLAKNIYYYTVDNRYWSIAPNIQKYKMITIRNPKNTEIRFVKTDILPMEDEYTIYYLPISKYFIKIEASQK